MRAEFGRTLGGPDLKTIEEVGQLPFDEPPTTGDKDSASTANSLRDIIEDTVNTGSASTCTMK